MNVLRDCDRIASPSSDDGGTNYKCQTTCLTASWEQSVTVCVYLTLFPAVSFHILSSNLSTPLGESHNISRSHFTHRINRKKTYKMIFCIMTMKTILGSLSVFFLFVFYILIIFSRQFNTFHPKIIFTGTCQDIIPQLFGDSYYIPIM